jgi:hypothetical protein
LVSEIRFRGRAHSSSRSALRSDRPKRRRASLRASVSSDRSAQDRSKARPDEVVQTPVARLSGRAASRATNACVIHASTTRVASGVPRQSADTSGWSPARFISTGAPVRGTPAQPGRGCPGRDRERGSGRIPGSDVVHRDAAVLNGSDRILSWCSAVADDAEWMSGKSRNRLAPVLTEAFSWTSDRSAQRDCRFR